MSYILAIDQGTTGTSVLVMDHKLKRISEASLDFSQFFPKPGWVEHDLDEIWATVLKTIQKAVSSISPQQIVAIGITNQRETLCFWNKHTLEPLGRAIVWQDRRSAALCESLRNEGLEPFFQKNTGLLLDPYFSGTKAAWALENWPDVQKAYQLGALAVGTMDSFLIAKLSGGAQHRTEPSNASRTLCFHLTDHVFDQELCSALQVPQEIWPEVVPSVGVFARTKHLNVIPDGIPITGVLGDQQAALLGQACIRPGMAKCTYGTGAFLLFNTGEQPVLSQHRLLTTVAWALSPTEYTYALEGSAFIAGAAVQWLQEGLGLIQSAEEIEVQAKTVSSSEGVVFVPALTGLGAPHWKPHATGCLTGLTRGTQKGHIARAVLEGIAFQNADILQAMTEDLGKPLLSLKVDGGASANSLLMQFQANILGIPLQRPRFQETTILGAVFAAGLGAQLWTNLQDIEKTWQEDCSFFPQIHAQERQEILKRWKKAVAQSYG